MSLLKISRLPLRVVAAVAVVVVDVVVQADKPANIQRRSLKRSALVLLKHQSLRLAVAPVLALLPVPHLESLVIPQRPVQAPRRLAVHVVEQLARQERVVAAAGVVLQRYSQVLPGLLQLNVSGHLSV